LRTYSNTTRFRRSSALYPSSVLFDGRQIDAFRGAKRFPQVADPFEPLGNGVDREIFALHTATDFVPRQRRRDPRVLARPRAVGRRERLAGDVLQVIDVHAPASRAHGPLDR